MSDHLTNKYGPKRNILTGRRFGRLTVIDFAYSSKWRISFWLTKCDCGKTKVISGNSLNAGITVSCGCYAKEAVSKANKTHGQSKTKFYSIWFSMKSRCQYKRNASYQRYGGRGILVCARWKTFENFYKDMFQSYLKHTRKFHGDTSIERIDNNGNYCVANCKWATAKEQANNRTPRKLKLDGQTNR